MKVLITGSRDWSNYQAMYDVLRGLPKETVVIHGGCRGADMMAGVISRKLGLKEVKVYKADWKRYGRAAGPKRNQKMIDENPDIDLTIAFHEDLASSKGTRDMVMRSQKAGIETKVVTG